MLIEPTTKKCYWGPIPKIFYWIQYPHQWRFQNLSEFEKWQLENRGFSEATEEEQEKMQKEVEEYMEREFGYSDYLSRKY